MRGFTLALFTALPEKKRTDNVRIDPSITALSWSSQLPGGFNTLSVGVTPEDTSPAIRLSRPVDARKFGHGELYAGSLRVWEGCITRRLWTGSRVTGLQLTGYGLVGTRDGFYTSSDATVLTSGAVLRLMIQAVGVAPKLRIGNPDLFVDPGVAHAPKEADRLTVAAWADQTVKEGNSAGQKVDFGVWRDRTVVLRPRLMRFLVPEWRIPFDDSVLTTEDLIDTYGTAQVRYTPPGGVLSYVSASSPNFVDRIGFDRSTPLDGSTLTAAGAAQFAQSWINAHGDGIISQAISRTGRGLENAAGVTMPAYMVEAGQWCQVGGEDPRILVRVSYDASSEALSIDLDSFVPNQHQLVSDLVRAAQHQLTGTSPLTGTRIA